MDIKDIVLELELADARLSDDIDFLHSIENEYFAFKEPKESAIYLYQQLSSAITTAIKSMELNQLKMNEVIDNYYKEIRKEKENNGNTSISNSENQEAEKVQA